MHTSVSNSRVSMQKSEIWWFIGRGATGKSTTARKENPDHYVKQLDTNWGGYMGQSCVIIDGCDLCSRENVNLVKTLCSESGFTISIGDVTYPSPKKIIFISSTAYWTYLTPEDRAILWSRIRIRFFGEL